MGGGGLGIRGGGTGCISTGVYLYFPFPAVYIGNHQKQIMIISHDTTLFFSSSFFAQFLLSIYFRFRVGGRRGGLMGFGRDVLFLRVLGEGVPGAFPLGCICIPISGCVHGESPETDYGHVT